VVEDLRAELLTQELPVLIRNVIDTSDISETIKARLTKEQHSALEDQAYGEAENFLDFTQQEVNELAKARTSLFQHEGRSPSANTSRARLKRTPKPTEGKPTAEPSTSTTTTTAGEVPDSSAPTTTAIGAKDSLRLALAMLALANLAVFGCIFGVWAAWNLVSYLGWPWKLFIAASCYAAAISVAAMLVAAAELRMAMTAPGLPRRTLDGNGRSLSAWRTVVAGQGFIGRPPASV
jgi:hypothetical protein